MAGRVNVGTIYGGIELDNRGFKGVLSQSKQDMAKAALDMQKSSRVKFDLTEFKKLSSQLGALKVRAHETRMALLKATPGSAEAKKLQSELRGLEARMRMLKNATEPARKELERLARAKREAAGASGLRQGLEGAVGALPGSLGSLASSAMSNPYVAIGTAVVALDGAAVLAAGSLAKMASEIEVAKVGLEGLLGSADKANAFFAQLQQFAAQTPFEMPGLMQASRLLLALGFSAEQVLPTMKAVGDAVGYLGGSPETMDRIILALGQMRQKGKVSAQEMNQLAEAGIPAWEMLAKKIGVSIPQAMKMAENGAISASVALPAILNGMNERFAGGMERLSQTTQGLFSTSKDNILMWLAEIGKPLNELAGKAFKRFNDAWPKIKALLTPIFESIWNAIKRIWDVIKPVMNLLGKSVLTGIVGGLKAVELAFRAIAGVLEKMGPRLAPLKWVAEHTGLLGAPTGNQGVDVGSIPEGNNPAPAKGRVRVRVTRDNPNNYIETVMAAQTKMKDFRRELYLNGNASNYWAMAWETLNGQFAKAPPKIKEQLMHLANLKDKQDAARKSIEEFKNSYVDALKNMLEAMQKWAGDAARAMREFSRDVLGEIKDGIMRESEEAQRRYQKLGELGAAGAAAMTGVRMFGEKKITPGMITPERIAAAAQAVTANRANEAAMQGMVNKNLFGNSIASYEAIANAGLAGNMPSKMDAQIGLLQTAVATMAAQLNELRKINQPAVQS